eukprot:EG_transcript_34214
MSAPGDCQGQSQAHGKVSESGLQVRFWNVQQTNQTIAPLKRNNEKDDRRMIPSSQSNHPQSKPVPNSNCGCFQTVFKKSLPEHVENENWTQPLWQGRCTKQEWSAAGATFGCNTPYLGQALAAVQHSSPGARSDAQSNSMWDALLRPGAPQLLCCLEKQGGGDGCKK